jgi:hypothetical protein
MTVLSLSAALYLVGVILLLPFGATVGDDTNRVALSSSLSLDARTAGLPFAAVGSFSARRTMAADPADAESAPRRQEPAAD